LIKKYAGLNTLPTEPINPELQEDNYALF